MADLESQIAAFWATAAPLLRRIQVNELHRDLPLITPATEKPLDYIMRLTPSGAAYVQVILAIRAVNPALNLLIRMEPIQLNPLESAAAITSAAAAAANPTLQRNSVAVVCRLNACIAGNDQGALTPLIEQVWAAAPFISPDWVCTKYIPPVPNSILQSDPSLAPLSKVLVRFSPDTDELYLLMESVQSQETLVGAMSMLLGEHLFGLLVERFTFRVLYRFTPVYERITEMWRAAGIHPQPFASLPETLQQHYSVTICRRCGLSSDNIRMEGRHCQYCAAFQENITRALLQPPVVPGAPDPTAVVAAAVSSADKR